MLLVANHSGQLPFDAAMIGVALLIDEEPPRASRAMVEKFVPTVPFVSTFMARWGQITGTPENCRRLLDDEEAILVFPEGARGISKPFSQRYQLQEFGLGFMRLALETGTPIVPVAVIGAEEQAPALSTSSRSPGCSACPAFPVMPLPPFFPICRCPRSTASTSASRCASRRSRRRRRGDRARRCAWCKTAIQSMIERRPARSAKHVFW